MAFGSVRRGLHRSVAVGKEGPHVSSGSSLCFNLRSGPWVGIHGGVADPIRYFGISYQYSLLLAFMLLVICPLLQNSYSYLVFPLSKSQLCYPSNLLTTSAPQHQAKQKLLNFLCALLKPGEPAVLSLSRLFLSHFYTTQLLTQVRLLLTQTVMVPLDHSYPFRPTTPNFK